MYDNLNGNNMTFTYIHVSALLTLYNVPQYFDTKHSPKEQQSPECHGKQKNCAI